MLSKKPRSSSSVRVPVVPAAGVAACLQVDGVAREALLDEPLHGSLGALSVVEGGDDGLHVGLLCKFAGEKATASDDVSSKAARDKCKDERPGGGR